MPPPDRRREFLKYGLPMVPTVLAVWLVSQSDRLVLSHFIAKSDLGVYAFGASLATYMVFLGYAVYPLLLPGASKLHDGGDKAGVQALFQRCARAFHDPVGGRHVRSRVVVHQDHLLDGRQCFRQRRRRAGASDPVFCRRSRAADGHLSICVSFGEANRSYSVAKSRLCAIIIISLAIAGFTSGIVLAPWAVLVATLIFNVLRYRIALRYMFIPVPGMLVAKVVALAVLTVTARSLCGGLERGPATSNHGRHCAVARRFYPATQERAEPRYVIVTGID